MKYYKTDTSISLIHQSFEVMDQPQSSSESSSSSSSEEPPEYISPRGSINNDDTEPLNHPDPPPPYKSQENINEDNRHEVSSTDINQITSAGKPLSF